MTIIDPDDPLVQQILRRHAATEIAAELLAASGDLPPVDTPTLEAEVAAAPQQVEWRVRGLIPRGANVLVSALAKSGKSTLMGQIARALVDSRPLCGRWQACPSGRVGIWNLEVGKDQYVRWLADMMIRRADRISVAHLRGVGVDLGLRRWRQWAVDWLRLHEIRHWVLDPLARAYRGDENSAPDLGRWLEHLDQIKIAAGVDELILVAHTGKAPSAADGRPLRERARTRGSQRLEDWADAIIYLWVDDHGQRWLRAWGRDVDLPPTRLIYTPATRELRVAL